VPWRRVLTSTQLWGPFLTSFGSDWGFYTFLTLGPKYMASILGVDIKQVNLYILTTKLKYNFLVMVVDNIKFMKMN
jgi:hypothetical protein